MLRFFIVLAAATQIALSYEVTYENYKLYKVYLGEKEAKEKFTEITVKIPTLDIWGQDLPKKTLDVMVVPRDEKHFNDLLSKNGITYEIISNNVEELIKKASKDIFVNSARNSEFNWTSYHSYQVIYDWLDSLAEQYPGQVTTFVAGKSYLGVDIKGVKIQLDPNATRVAVIDAGLHAREWIAPATATYLINAFLTSSNPRVISAARQMIWYILPVANPDGYDHTMNVDRLHRKNLRPDDNIDCSNESGGGNGVGVDLNRNFEFMWMYGGASDYPCSVTYAGPSPFSEPESLAIKSLVDSVGNDLQVYLTLHSYSQLILHPYGHTVNPLDNYYEQYAVGRLAADAIENYSGKKYTVGNSAEAIYVSTGASDDWVKATYKPRLVYCLELRDEGYYGFTLPADQIIENAEEILTSVTVFIEQLLRFDLLSTVEVETPVTTTPSPPPPPPVTTDDPSGNSGNNLQLYSVLLFCSYFLFIL